ncbi:MAG: asparagine synthase (glutamine-hydrolyzing) [Acidimicrobiales bacterium]
MCGIAGAVGLDRPLDPARARAVLGALAHRGPDAVGEQTINGVWLGFRRLSILDLERRADQPFHDEQARLNIVFNGEIYNYVELRRQLEQRGWSFRTTGDTEVLLNGYQEWGLGVFDRANGMWACAIHDASRPDVLLSRDRFGEKPLYYGQAADGWWFASEPLALRAAGAGTGRADAERIAAFLSFGDVEHPTASYFEGISQLEPGCTMRLGPEGPTALRRYWNIDDVVGNALRSPTPSSHCIRGALDDAVRIRMRADVTVGTSLSGGVDSSTIIASMRVADSGRAIHAFTSSFPGDPSDEWQRADLVARRNDVTLHRVVPDPASFVTEIDSLVEHQGGPIESPTVYAQWCVMRAAREAGVTVLLDGQGADEVFGGYRKYFWIALASEMTRGRPDRAATMWREWANAHDIPALSLRQLAPVTVPGVMAPLVAAGSRPLSGLLGPALREARPSLPLARSAHGSLLSRAATTDLSRLLLPRLLRYGDRNSMAWSREMRLPFLDPAVVTAGLASAWDRGMQHGWTKFALRTAMAERLPDEVVWRRDKTAYEVPEKSWLTRPDILEAIAGARQHLASTGIVHARRGRALNPWRALSLSRFLLRYEVTL